ncbi:PRC-barrel domain-containing protein [Crassaminicella profunda]|uniref:PRC-barrel domain-containing protein n=1 Tax=Crassaminicella profunda TaxID=1286698 RepID=UPI001CA7865F|nr:PRC-barrel domain-containing protein [Crassaminicella profunda]QZY57012.1 PRC-barrel domain-containing protein [Crassaminicella profunda]
MMKRGCDIIGLPVISLDEGCKTFEIKDIIYCNQNLKVTAFLVHEGGYFHEPMVVYFEHVKNIGENAVTIQNDTSIKRIKYSMSQLQSREKLLGLEVITDDGKHVGTVQDIMIEIGNGRLLGLILTEGLFDDLVEGRSILPFLQSFTIHQDAIIITSSISASILQGTGGLKNLLSLE